MELTGTHLRYLLHMYEMSQREDEMRLTEIAKALHVKKSIRCADCQHFSGKTACGSAAIWETSLDSIRKRGGGAVCRDERARRSRRNGLYSVFAMDGRIRL